MPYGAVTLIPGINVEKTPTLNEAGISQSQLIRFRDGLSQKLGGWTQFYQFNIAGVPRELHAWQDLNKTDHLGIGSTTQLGVVTNSTYQDITPQTLTSNFIPSFSATAGMTTIGVYDPNVSDVSVYDSVVFNVPVSAGGAVLSGVFPIVEITGTHTYDISIPVAALTTNVVTASATTLPGSTTLHFTALPTSFVSPMTVFDLNAATAIAVGTVVATTSTTSATLSTAVVGTVFPGDPIVFDSVPTFTATGGSNVVAVNLLNSNLAAGDTAVFPIPTTNASAGITVGGAYDVVSAADVNDFSISVSNQAATSAVFPMNGAQAQLVYYINLGPPPIGSGYGLGGYGLGGYGTGVTVGQQTGTEITATDWTSDNWGEIYLACPAGGGVYQWNPTSGFTNAGLVATAPPFNGGIFVSMQQEILVCWGSTVQAALGIQQDPLLINFSTVGDYTNFVPLATDQAGDFRIPTGSKIVGGIAAPNQDLIITDIDCWAMNYQGFPYTFGFNKIGAGAGLISSHALTQLRGNVYWMGPSNFYVYAGGAVSVIPCPVWDFVFQNLNGGVNPQTGVAYTANVRAMPNTPFNEVGFAFPSMASVNGENDSYVKFNVSEPNVPWDYGSLNRSAWTDQGVLGPPIGAVSAGTIYQHETSNDAAGQPLVASFTTGYFFIAEGEDYAFIDQVLPDFRWGFYGAAQTAQIQLTFNIVNFPGDTPQSFGPYLVTQSTEILSVRLRGRQMSITVQSSDSGSFWRLGRIRYRYAPSGRR